MGDIVQVLVTGLTTGSTIALVALGINIIFATTRIVNFAQGGIVVAAGYVAFVFTAPDRLGLNVWVAFVLVIVVGIVLGVFIDLWGISPLGGFSASENPGWIVMTFSIIALTAGGAVWDVPVVVALGAIGLLAGLLWEFFRAAPSGRFDPTTNISWIITTFAIGIFLIPAVVSKAITSSSEKIPDLVGGVATSVAGSPITWSDVFIVLFAIGLMVGIELLLSKTMIGRAFAAVSQDRQTASLMGVNVSRIVIFAFAIAGALGAIASILIAPKLFVKLENSLTLAFAALIGAVLGGLGSTRGAVVGAYIVAFVQALSAIYLGAVYGDIIVFVGLLFVLALKPTGLFGRVAVEKV